jgi:hypothetical protein
MEYVPMECVPMEYVPMECVPMEHVPMEYVPWNMYPWNVYPWNMYPWNHDTPAHRPRHHTLYDIPPILFVFQVTQKDLRSSLMMAGYCRKK